MSHRDHNGRTILAALGLGLALAGQAVHAGDIDLRFTGISVSLSGEEGKDFAVERLWHDRASDDDVVIYLKADTRISLGHNEHNLLGAGKEWTEGKHQGTIVYKVDGDGARTFRGNKYLTESKHPPLLAGQQFTYAEPFTVKPFVGRTGPRKPEGHWGMKGPFGDEWHTLTFWDVDAKTSKRQRDDQSSDGKIVYLVVDPRTPVIAFEAPEGGQYYTTPPKNYYTPHIFGRKTYLTKGVRIGLANITNGLALKYQVDRRPAEDYSRPLSAAKRFSKKDTVYRFTCWFDGGRKKERLIHYEPSQPASGERHPRLHFRDEKELARSASSLRGAALQAYLTGHCTWMTKEMDYRAGVRNLKLKKYSSYYYLAKTYSSLIYRHALAGRLTDNEGSMRRAADGLLFMYTIDPLGAESTDGRRSGPCQERAMYSDGRVTIGTAVAYDLLAGYFTRDRFRTGLTPIEHIKIRDNLAGEACVMLKFPTSNPQPFWYTRKPEGSPRNLQLECFIASLAMAMPTYDTPYYGTSGADGTTRATHLHAPFPNAAVTWIELNNKGFLQHPKDPKRFRDSVMNLLFDEDGAYVGQPRDGYLGMMHKDVIKFLSYRKNFDGEGYPRFEKYLCMRILQRYPFNGSMMPQAFFAAGFNPPDAFLAKLVRKDVPDAALYRWALEHPVKLPKVKPADPSVKPKAPERNARITQSFAVMSSDLSDPRAVMLRMRVLAGDYSCGGGTFLNYLGGHFNVAAYGERLAIEKAGYHKIKDYHYGISQIRKNTVMVDGQNDGPGDQVRGSFRVGLVTPEVSYAEMTTDLLRTSRRSAYTKHEVDFTRRVFFVDRKFFVFADEVRAAAGSHTYDWLLHGATGGPGGAFSRNRNQGQAIWRKKSGVRLLARFLSPVELNKEDLAEKDFIETNGFAEPYVRARVKGQRARYLVLLYPLDKTHPDPRVTPLEVPGAHAAAISGGAASGTVGVLFREKPGLADRNFGVRTDAQICVYKRTAEGAPAYLAMVDGTRASFGEGELSLLASARVTAVVAPAEGGGWQVLVAGGPEGPKTVSLVLGGFARGARKTVYVGVERRSVTASAGGELRISSLEVPREARGVLTLRIPRTAKAPTGKEVTMRTLELSDQSLTVKTLHEDDFSADTGDWLAEGGAIVSLKGGRLFIDAYRGEPHVATVWGRRPFEGDAVIEYVARVEKGPGNTNINFFVYGSNPDGSSVLETTGRRTGAYKEYHRIPNYIYTYLNSGPDGLPDLKTKDPANMRTRVRFRKDPGFHLLQEVWRDEAIHKGRDYRFTIAIQGARTRFYVEGERIFDYEDRDAPHRRGHHAFRTWMSHTSADLFLVSRIVRTAKSNRR